MFNKHTHLFYFSFHLLSFFKHLLRISKIHSEMKIYDIIFYDAIKYILMSQSYAA